MKERKKLPFSAWKTGAFLTLRVQGGPLPGLWEPDGRGGGGLRAHGRSLPAVAQVDAQGDEAAEEEEAVEADAPGHHDGGGHQPHAEEEGKGVEGHPLGGAHGAGQGEGATARETRAWVPTIWKRVAPLRPKAR